MMSAQKTTKSSATTLTRLSEHIVEIISDSGEGAQRCGQSFGSIAARMGNGIWTTEIIPAEIRPPARSVAGASGNRIRMGANYITNGGDQTDLVVAFNEQVMQRDGYAPVELKPGASSCSAPWRKHKDINITQRPMAKPASAWWRRAISCMRFRWRRNATRLPRTPDAARTCLPWACCATSTALTCSLRVSELR